MNYNGYRKNKKKELTLMNSLQDVYNATRAEIVEYLEGWGYACYDSECDEELKYTAICNYRTEGC